MQNLPTILTICGSTRSSSSSQQFVDALAEKYVDRAHWSRFSGLRELPQFDPDNPRLLENSSWVHLGELVLTADLILIVTPEYLHSIPSQLKALLEWSNADSIFAFKKVVSIVFTPTAPRGQCAKVHLEQILKALNVSHTLSCLLHHDQLDAEQNENSQVVDKEGFVAEMMEVITSTLS